MNHEIVIETLKAILKSKKIKYKALADEIGISESGLKKLLVAKDISFNRLTQIINALGISLSDLIDLANEEEIKNIELNKKQEDALLSDNKLLRVLWRISVENRSEEETIDLEKLTNQKLTSYLLKLENLDLIKTTKFGNLVSVHKGIYRWAKESQLIKKLNREWSTMLLAKALINDKDSLHKLSFLRLSTASKIQLNRRLCELVDDFARISRRDKMIHPNKDLYPTSMLVATITEGFLD